MAQKRGVGMVGSKFGTSWGIGLTAFLALCTGMAAQAQSANPKENLERIEKIARVVAKVTDVWVKDARYNAFHKEISDKYAGTPPLDRFVADDQWVVVLSSPSILYSGIYKGKGKSEMDLKFGDIVMMKVTTIGTVKTYDELNSIERVICKAGMPDYAECVKSNPLSWFDTSGKMIEQFR
jgi:hypothetical protein